MNIEEFKQAIKDLGIIAPVNSFNKIEEFYNLLIDWNKKMNLTRITNKEEAYLKHFYDSLTLVKIHDLTGVQSICDVGSGAGFPGIVLKIFFPDLKITLVDSLQKRVNYLNEVINELGLKEIVAIHARAEDYARKHYETYDIVTARAVANLKVLSELCIPMVKVDGFFLSMKGNCLDEIKEAQETLNLLSSVIIDQKEFLLPEENSHRTLIKIRKSAPTNHKYPRSMDKIKK